jgi:predicted protein tyrosine phosphatase/predicted RNase H-like HicB family nuclease
MFAKEIPVDMPKVIVVSEENFKSICEWNQLDDETVEYSKSTAFISIVDPHRTNKHHFKQEHPNVLNLVFSDMTDKEYLGYTQGYIEQGISVRKFDISDAEKIVEFIDRNSKNGVKQWIIHCHAGISRSGAVGLFINNYLRYDWKSFKLDNPRVRPNFYIIHMLNVASETIGGKEFVEINEFGKYKLKTPLIMTIYKENENEYIGRIKSFDITSYGTSLEELTENIKSNLSELIEDFKDNTVVFSKEWTEQKNRMLTLIGQDLEFPTEKE